LSHVDPKQDKSCFRKVLLSGCGFEFSFAASTEMFFSFSNFRLGGWSHGLPVTH
jgi:hypothetical protein